MYTAEHIKDFFQYHQEELSRVFELAHKIRETIRVIDPFIQQHTSVVCPECPEVCCVNKHAYYNNEDLVFIHALGLEPHAYEQRPDLGPCQFLSAEGCVLDRTVRPSGCNWYFCDALCDSMEKSPGGAYADFDGVLQDLADLWLELEADFRAKFRKIKGSGGGPESEKR